MNMFDDLDDGFEPSTHAALPAVSARVKQMRTRRRLTAIGVITAVVVVGLATVAFALPRGHRDAQVEIQPPTTTTSTPADQPGNADKVHRSRHTATTATTVAKSSSASAAAPLSRKPTYRAQLVPAAHDAEDYSALQVSVAPTAVTALQGNTATTSVTVHNAGSWTVTPPKPTCDVIEPNMTPPCNGRALDTTPLVPGATRTYTVTLYAVHTPASGPQVAVDPGDYIVPVL